MQNNYCMHIYSLCQGRDSRSQAETCLLSQRASQHCHSNDISSTPNYRPRLNPCKRP
ncbi:unknown protein [Desulfotalea psychrophila LSv54]|uniref:Uncharacterized protein n=1 Tax=Desulfotalea psychrophila (strain LSv54 / DSM 12343) TaxID=177439 RepID=Q6AQY4_DESPS|nr:unknown protein [Desulfotalea psychrophila LSv54]